MLTNEEIEAFCRVGDFDRFREVYHELSFEQLKFCYKIWTEVYPEQKYWNLEWFLGCIREIQEKMLEPIWIAELGGYDGELALEVFKAAHTDSTPIIWDNYDLISHERLSSELKARPYKEIILNSHFYDSNPDLFGVDLFLASDTLEHFTDEEVERILKTVAKCSVDYILLKMPIKPDGQDWKGQSAAHLCTLGQEAIKEFLSVLGYKLIREEGNWMSFFELT